jgi:methylmalonyl-CoA/ethylmalonyl-CoA epimerase
MIARIDHIAIAVKDITRALDFFQNILGAVPGTMAEDGNMKYVWRNFSLGDLSRIELLNSTGSGSFLDGFLSNKDGGVHHITMQTPDIKKARKILEEKGIPYFGYNEYPVGIWKELFIHPRDAFGVLIQLAEFNADDWLADSAKIPCGKKWELNRNGEEYSLSFEHPGGGRVTLELSGSEIKRLISDLNKA